jgi:UMP-CMP kinase
MKAEVGQAARLLDLVARAGVAREELRTVFKLIDLDNSGTIERDELRSLVSHEAITDSEMNAFFKRGDHITFDEFVGFVMDSRNQLLSQKLVRTNRVMFVVGGPASGKGTICGELARRNHNIVHLSSGELLRDEIWRGSALGQRLAEQIARGELVAACVVLSLIEQSLAARPGRLVLLDGFPRSLQNAIDYQRIYRTCEGLLLFECPEHEMIRRIVERGRSSGRIDDNLETAARRVAVFREQSEAAVSYLCNLGFPVLHVDTTRPVEENVELLMHNPLFKAKT